MAAPRQEIWDLLDYSLKHPHLDRPILEYILAMDFQTGEEPDAIEAGAVKTRHARSSSVCADDDTGDENGDDTGDETGDGTDGGTDDGTDDGVSRPGVIDQEVADTVAQGEPETKKFVDHPATTAKRSHAEDIQFAMDHVRQSLMYRRHSMPRNNRSQWQINRRAPGRQASKQQPQPEDKQDILRDEQESQQFHGEDEWEGFSDDAAEDSE